MTAWAPAWAPAPVSVSAPVSAPVLSITKTAIEEMMETFVPCYKNLSPEEQEKMILKQLGKTQALEQQKTELKAKLDELNGQSSAQPQVSGAESTQQTIDDLMTKLCPEYETLSSSEKNNKVLEVLKKNKALGRMIDVLKQEVEAKGKKNDILTLEVEAKMCKFIPPIAREKITDEEKGFCKTVMFLGKKVFDEVGRLVGWISNIVSRNSDVLAAPVTSKGFTALFQVFRKRVSWPFRKPLELVNCGVAWVASAFTRDSSYLNNARNRFKGLHFQ